MFLDISDPSDLLKTAILVLARTMLTEILNDEMVIKLNVESKIRRGASRSAGIRDLSGNEMSGYPRLLLGDLNGVKLE